MVREYSKKYNLYTAEYYEHQAELLSQYQEKKRQIEEYLREIKDVIIDDVMDSIRDKRQSLDARVVVNAPKTPGMTIRRTKRKMPEKRVEIDVNSPNASFVSEPQGNTTTKARFAGLNTTADTATPTNGMTPTNTMTPNRSQSALKQTRLQSLLEQNSVNCTPTGNGRGARLTRAKAKLLEQSLINSTISSMQSSVNTPTLKTKLLDRYNESNSMTPVNTTMTPNRTHSTEPNTTPTADLTAVKTAALTAVGATPVRDTCVSSSTPAVAEFPAANSTMMQPGTPAAAFGGNITLITGTPAQSTPVGGKVESLVVSSPIGPITTTGTPTSNLATQPDTNSGDWVVSTGKRKSSKVDNKPAVLAKGNTPGPASTPVIKRLQLSTCPSPAPVATPADKQPALLSVTIPPNTPTPDNVTVPLFPSPVDQAPATAGTPGLQVAATVGTPVREAVATAGTPVLKGATSVGTPVRNAEAPVGTPVLDSAARAGTPVLDADLTRTPNMADIRTPGALCRTPGLKRVQEVGVIEKERERSGNDMVFIEEEEAADEIEDEAEVSFGPGVANTRTGVAEEKMTETPDIEDTCQDKETEQMDTCENEQDDLPVESVPINIDTSMQSEPAEQNEELMEPAENDHVSPVKVYEHARYESEHEAMDVAEAPSAERDEQSVHEKFFESPNVVEKVVKPVTPIVEEKVHQPPEVPQSTSDQPELPAKVDLAPETETTAPEEEEEGNESNQLFESCDEGEDKENEGEDKENEREDKENEGVVKEDVTEVKEVEQFSDAREDEVAVAAPLQQIEEEEEEEEEAAPPPKTPVPVRQTRSSRNKRLEESKKKSKDTEKKREEEVEETQTRTRTRSKKQSAEECSPSQGTVKKIAASYDKLSKQTTSGIPTLTTKTTAKDDRLDMSKREREESESDSVEERTTASADESIHLKKRMKDNAGVPRNPHNLVTSVISFVNKPTVVVKSAKELEQEKKEAAKKRIEEKEAKAQQVLNKKKQRENELRLKRIEKEKRMRQAKQNKEEEAKRKKADLEERMRKKDETSAKEREILAKKEEEKRQREMKKQELAEQRRRQAEKARELKKKKLQEEAEERKVEALKRKQELEALKVRELEKHRLDEEARMEEQRKVEAEEQEKRLKAEEERRKQQEEVEKKKTTPSRLANTKKLNLTGAGTLLNMAGTPPPRPPPRTNKQTNSKIPTKLVRAVEEAVKTVEEAVLDVEEASNLGAEEDKRNTFTATEKRVDMSADKPGLPLTKTTSGLLTPIAQTQQAADSPSSAASSRIQSYMKNKLLSLGQAKNKRNLGSRLDAISEDHANKRSVPTYDPRDNYKIDDMESGDDTDEETKPKRTIPSWARNKLTLNESLRKQFSGTEQQHSAKTIFGPYPKTADLDQLFGTVNRYTSRTSSAHWSAPPATGNLDFSILTEDEINHANNILLKYNR